MGKSNQFTESYKREAAAKAQASGNISATARELGISDKSLYRWVKQYGDPVSANPEEATPAQLTARIKQLEKQLAVRDEQIEVLKKAIRARMSRMIIPSARRISRP